ncbi:hypothetical protein A2U01_0071862, partial [Trifolium medium]|nr:hypothetical protein [Trifolium medium]
MISSPHLKRVQGIRVLVEEEPQVNGCSSFVSLFAFQDYYRETQR